MPAKLDHPPVVKSTQQIAKKSRPFPFDAVWSEAAYLYARGTPLPNPTKRRLDQGTSVPHCHAFFMIRIFHYYFFLLEPLGYLIFKVVAEQGKMFY